MPLHRFAFHTKPLQAPPTRRPSPALRPQKRGSLDLIPVAVLLSALLTGAFYARTAAANQDTTLLSLLTQMESSYTKVHDYTATFNKQECVENLQQPLERMVLKFQKPFKVYMKWIDDPTKEALYVDGEYNNKVVARFNSLLGPMTMSFTPNSSAIMRSNRHPITDIGFGFIIDVMRKNIPAAVERSEVTVLRVSDETFENRPSSAIEAKFTPKDGRKYYTSRMVLHMDKEMLLPVGIACYDEKDVLQEQYSYGDVKINAGLTDQDFSKDNSAYRF